MDRHTQGGQARSWRVHPNTQQANRGAPHQSPQCPPDPHREPRWPGGPFLGSADPCCSERTLLPSISLLWDTGASAPLWASFPTCKVRRWTESLGSDGRFQGTQACLPCPALSPMLVSESGRPPSVPGSVQHLHPCGSQALAPLPSCVSFCPGKSQFAELGAYVDGNVEKYFNHSSNLCLYSSFLLKVSINFGINLLLFAPPLFFFCNYIE